MAEMTKEDFKLIVIEALSESNFGCNGERCLEKCGLTPRQHGVQHDKMGSVLSLVENTQKKIWYVGIGLITVSFFTWIGNQAWETVINTAKEVMKSGIIR